MCIDKSRTTLTSTEANIAQMSRVQLRCLGAHPGSIQSMEQPKHPLSQPSIQPTVLTVFILLMLLVDVPCLPSNWRQTQAIWRLSRCCFTSQRSGYNCAFTFTFAFIRKHSQRVTVAVLVCLHIVLWGCCALLMWLMFLWPVASPQQRHLQVIYGALWQLGTGRRSRSRSNGNFQWQHCFST